MVALPSWDQFMIPVLELQSDGEVRSLRSVRTDVAAAVLTEDQRATVLPSGVPKADNRIGWAVSYLYRVGALERPARGDYRITRWDDDCWPTTLRASPRSSCGSMRGPATRGGRPRPPTVRRE